MTDLLGKHSDLMNEFNDYLERCENTGNCFATLLFIVVFRIFSCLDVSFCLFVFADGFLAVVTSASMSTYHRYHYNFLLHLRSDSNDDVELAA